MKIKGRARNGVEKVHGHNVRAEFFQREGQFTTVLASLPHAQDAPRTDLDPGFLEVLDRLNPIFIGMCGADLWVEPSRGLQVMVVTFQT